MMHSPLYVKFKTISVKFEVITTGCWRFTSGY